MSEDTVVDNDSTTDDTVDNNTRTDANNNNNDLEATINKVVEDRLAQMKANMNRMAKERDEALKKAAELEKAQKEAKMKQLEEEGKLKELAEMKNAELEAKLRVYEEENVKLKRDQVLTSKLATLEFKNERSRDMAYRDIVDQLIQDDSGRWAHKSGMSIEDFVESYSKDENNSFLFRAKSNSGAGMSNPAGASDTSQPKKIGDMSTQEVLALAAKGKLGNFKY